MQTGLEWKAIKDEGEWIKSRTAIHNEDINDFEDNIDEFDWSQLLNNDPGDLDTLWYILMGVLENKRYLLAKSKSGTCRDILKLNDISYQEREYNHKENTLKLIISFGSEAVKGYIGRRVGRKRISFTLLNNPTFKLQEDPSYKLLID